MLAPSDRSLKVNPSGGSESYPDSKWLLGLRYRGIGGAEAAMPLKLREKYNYGETVSRPERIILARGHARRLGLG